MKKLLILQGIPASGKTTWAKKQTGWKRVNLDDLRAMIDNSEWSHDNERLIQSIQLSIIRQMLRAGHNVIVDNTHMNKDALRRMYKFAEEVGDVEVELKPFTTPESVCRVRNSMRDVPVPESAMDRMAKCALSEPGVQQFISKTSAITQDQTKPRTVLCDLDGTLALHNGRNPYDASTCDQDLLNSPVERCIRAMMASGYRIVFLSGRDEKYREPTERFLNKWALGKWPLIMRKSGDIRNDAIVKRELFNEHIAGQMYVEFVLDDRDRVVRMWRDMGLTVFQVAEGDF